MFPMETTGQMKLQLEELTYKSKCKFQINVKEFIFKR